jgi:hypothetical protein
MMRMGVVSLLMLGTLSACGHTPEERLVSGALIGATAGAIVGLASDPRHDDGYRRDYYRSERRYDRDRHHGHHRKGGWRRHRDYDDGYDDWRY